MATHYECKVCGIKLIFATELEAGVCEPCLEDMEAEFKKWDVDDDDPFPGDFWDDQDFEDEHDNYH